MTPAVVPQVISTKQVAPAWHTVTLVAILLAIAARGAMFQKAPVTVAPASRLPTYAALIVAELLLLYFVWRGIKRRGVTLDELIGGRWATGRDVAVDVLRGAALWGLLSLAAFGWTRWLPQLSEAKSISPLLPQSAVEIIAWIALSACAGIVEEIVFRGYLQRQLAALSGSAGVGLVGQALIFGVSHGYQGIDACARITLIGLMFGALALWRSSLRPGMIAHVWTDVASGVFRI